MDNNDKMRLIDVIDLFPDGEVLKIFYNDEWVGDFPIESDAFDIYLEYEVIGLSSAVVNGSPVTLVWVEDENAYLEV